MSTNNPIVRSAKLHVEKTEYDIGRIPEKSEIHQIDMPISNVGTDPLSLAFKMSTCGCVEVTEYDNYLLPGDSGLIRVSLDPSSGRAGSNIQLIRFATNDPSHPLLEITLSYYIGLYDLQLSPHIVNFNITKQELLAERRVQIGSIYIKDDWERRLEIEDVRLSNCNFVYDAYDTIYTCPSGQKSHIIRLNFLAGSDLPAGITRETAILYTNHPEYPSIEIPIRGLVEPRIKTSPKVLLLRNLEAGQSVHREIKIEAKTEELEIGKLKLGHPWLKASKKRMTRTEEIIILDGIVPENPQDRTSVAQIQIEIVKPHQYIESVEVHLFYKCTVDNLEIDG